MYFVYHGKQRPTAMVCTCMHLGLVRLHLWEAYLIHVPHSSCSSLFCISQFARVYIYIYIYIYRYNTRTPERVSARKITWLNISLDVEHQCLTIALSTSCKSYYHTYTSINIVSFRLGVCLKERCFSCSREALGGVSYESGFCEFYTNFVVFSSLFWGNESEKCLWCPHFLITWRWV